MKTIILIILLGCAEIGFAATLTVSPNTVRVNDAGASVVNIRWRIAITVTGPPTTVTLNSGAGMFGIGSALGRQLSRTLQHPGGGTVIFTTLNERLRIDRTTLKSIRQIGGTTYTRTFTDTSGPPATGVVLIRPTSGGGFPFVISCYGLMITQVTAL